jgi:hypothetical protein
MNMKNEICKVHDTPRAEFKETSLEEPEDVVELVEEPEEGEEEEEEEDGDGDGDGEEEQEEEVEEVEEEEEEEGELEEFEEVNDEEEGDIGKGRAPTNISDRLS